MSSPFSQISQQPTFDDARKITHSQLGSMFLATRATGSNPDCPLLTSSHIRYPLSIPPTPTEIASIVEAMSPEARNTFFMAESQRQEANFRLPGLRAQEAIAVRNMITLASKYGTLADYIAKRRESEADLTREAFTERYSEALDLSTGLTQLGQQAKQQQLDAQSRHEAGLDNYNSALWESVNIVCSEADRLNLKAGRSDGDDGERPNNGDSDDLDPGASPRLVPETFQISTSSIAS